MKKFESSNENSKLSNDQMLCIRRLKSEAKGEFAVAVTAQKQKH
jgi:hypothetical protein